METPLVQAIMPGGANPLLGPLGVEVMHVAHHGSESSTNFDFMNRLTPMVACISVGGGQPSNYLLPRKNVVENVLLAQAHCITASPALVLQTDDGERRCCLAVRRTGVPACQSLWSVSANHHPTPFVSQAFQPAVIWRAGGGARTTVRRTTDGQDARPTNGGRQTTHDNDASRIARPSPTLRRTCPHRQPAAGGPS